MYKLLIVDDEALAKISLQEVIDWNETAFTIVGTADNGLTALRYLQTHPVDAVVTDLQMPVMDGIALIHALREQGFQGPILALSNYSDFELVRGALTAGAFDYLLKVNLDSSRLLKLLDQMAAIISQNAERADTATRKDHLIAQQTRDLARSAFRNYLLDPQERSTPPDLSCLLTDLSFPVTVCTIIIDRETVANAPGTDFLQLVVNEVFEDVGPVFHLPIRRNELLCLFSEQALAANGKKAQPKLSRVKKQVELFSSSVPLITYISGAVDLASVRKLYQICADSYERTFYNDGASPLELHLGGQQHNWASIRADYSSAAIACARDGRWDALYDQTAALIGLCQEAQVPPSELLAAIVAVIWYCHDLKLAPLSAEQVTNIQVQLNGMASMENLQTYLQWLLQRLAEPEKKPVHKEIQRAMQYVNDYYMNKITLEDVSRHVNLNREYLSRLFHDETGTNLFQYITEVRMRKAAELLRSNRDILIKEVAFAVGIDNPFFFSKKFKAFFGVSPANYQASLDKQDS